MGRTTAKRNSTRVNQTLTSKNRASPFWCKISVPSRLGGELLVDENSKIQKVKMMNLLPLRFIFTSLAVLVSLLSVSTSDVVAQEKNVDRVAGTRQSTVVLFDGKSLDQFRGYQKEEIGAGWKVEDGMLHFDGTKGSGDIVTKQEFENFVLKFEWKISEGGNSGVMYRVSLGDKRSYLSGPEYQVLDDAKHRDGKNPSTSAGALYALYVPQNKTLNPVGQWNKSKIVLNGNKVEHWLNGTKVVDAEIGSADWKEKVEASKFKTWEKFGKNSKGHLCFQDHGDKVWYRSITVDVLND